MTQYRYVGQSYSQGTNNHVLYSFVASARDVMKWAGVPSKTERFHGGFQRALSSRYTKIVQYFESGQISPGAIVVAFRPTACKISELSSPSNWPSDEHCTSKPKFVQIEFSSTDYSTTSVHELASLVRDLLQSRPGLLDTESTPIDFEEGSEDAGNIDEKQTVGKGDDEDEDELDVGRSKLRMFYDFLGSKEAISDWLRKENEKSQKIKLKKNPSKSERDLIEYSPEEKLKSTCISLLRPAMLVDGQHRVNGANESEVENVEFTVCAVHDANWVEQVFQFVVLNKMARSISKDFLTELLNSSLTNSEVLEIDRRLDAIGIRNADRIIHKYINHDKRSPFAEMVAEAGEVSGADRSGKLSQQGMIALAKRWKAIAGAKKSAEMNMFIKYLSKSSLSEARAAWANVEAWIPLFFAFWSVIKEKYEPEHIWVKNEGYNLLKIVTLQALQDHFIESKASGMIKFQSEEDFKEQVREFFQAVPALFFQNWNATGLQSGDGWQIIKDAVKSLQSGERLLSIQKESALWK
jgi:hypothetical protein